MAKKTFNIEVTMEERWIDDFCSMLEWMEYCGIIGHSSSIGFYVDGDGDFRPKFKIGTKYNNKDGIKRAASPKKLERFYDAG